MATSVPQSIDVSEMAAANAAAAAAIGSSTSASSSFLFAEQTNNLRLMAVYDRIYNYTSGGARLETSDVIRLCYSFAKAIDGSLILNDIPGIALRLPPLVKKVYEWRKNPALQPAIMMVLISIKNACKRGWFRAVETEELLHIVNEMCSIFCTDLCLNTHVSHAFDTISKIMPRFYPHLMLHSLIVSFEAKPGYDVLMFDFHLSKNQHREQKKVLIVVKTENLETSSCIANPQVSFLINGKAVEKRNNVALHCGPQLPTDISKMLKEGVNVLQAIGYFDGTYLIAVGYMSKMTNFTTHALKDYVQPVVTHESDSEIIEGQSRILLNCPISLTRMKTPVKGHLCKHRQCFDYDNFLEINSRKPNWRCPHCNQPVCMIDLRIDQNMVKILEEVGEDVTEVVICADGTWNVVDGHHDDQVHDQTVSKEFETNKSKILMADPVDLTMDEEDDNCDITQTLRQELSINGCASQTYDHISEAEDIKPFIDVGFTQVPQFLANNTSNATQVPAYQPGNSIQPPFISSYATNGSVAPAGSLHMGSSQTLPPMLSNFVQPDALSPFLDQTQLAVNALPAVNNVNERIAGRPPPRYAPVAVQALPVLQQTHNTSRRLHANLLDTPLASRHLSPRQYQAVNVSGTPQENFSGGVSNMDVQHLTRTSDTSAMQDHIPNEAAMQQAVGLPSPSTLNSRSPFSHRRVQSDIDALRASLQPSLFSRNPLQTPPGFRAHLPMSQASSILLQSPSLPSVVHQTSQNTIGLAAGNFANQRSLAQASLPTPFSRSLPTSTSNLPASRENSRMVGADRWRSLTGGTPSLLQRSDGLPELPSEQNWRPTGRMRGSLTGSDYSAVISNYMPPLNQTATGRPSSSFSNSDQFSALIANNLLSHGALNHQINPSQDNFSTQQGDTRI